MVGEIFTGEISSCLLGHVQCVKYFRKQEWSYLVAIWTHKSRTMGRASKWTYLQTAMGSVWTGGAFGNIHRRNPGHDGHVNRKRESVIEL